MSTSSSSPSSRSSSSRFSVSSNSPNSPSYNRARSPSQSTSRVRSPSSSSSRNVQIVPPSPLKDTFEKDTDSWVTSIIKDERRKDKFCDPKSRCAIFLEAFNELTPEDMSTNAKRIKWNQDGSCKVRHPSSIKYEYLNLADLAIMNKIISPVYPRDVLCAILYCGYLKYQYPSGPPLCIKFTETLLSNHLKSPEELKHTPPPRDTAAELDQILKKPPLEFKLSEL